MGAEHGGVFTGLEFQRQSLRDDLLQLIERGVVHERHAALFLYGVSGARLQLDVELQRLVGLFVQRREAARARRRRLQGEIAAEREAERARLRGLSGRRPRQRRSRRGGRREREAAVEAEEGGGNDAA